MIKNPQNHRRQKYENLPITITERLSYRGVSTIYHSTHELNYSPVATSYVIRILDMFRISTSEQIPTAESQTNLQENYQTSGRKATPRICTNSQKSQKQTKTQGKEDIQTLQRVEEANGVGAL